MKWLIFITLKVVETFAVLFVPFYLGLFGDSIGLFSEDRPEHILTTWFAGIGVIILMAGTLFLCFLVGVVVFKMTDKNMEWAKKLSEWIKL